ncbi:unnamed protein product [Cercopithifilaria johnstoni]|uniref:Uncharacterized protein n=1 Tax=Cercopithifilaria johnstoni TaxID=2874296 RepID=A0A8J2M7Z5_9BILA|nr:unnamed protein product [Cercopithifilaria johnstoni]
MEYVTYVADIAEKEADVQRVTMSEEPEFELTVDELEHIAHISRMAEEAFGNQTLQSSEIDKNLVRKEDQINSNYEEYNVEENEPEKFSEQSQSRTSSVTSGPDSSQESMDIKMNSILPSVDMFATDDMKFTEDILSTETITPVTEMILPGKVVSNAETVLSRTSSFIAPEVECLLSAKDGSLSHSQKEFAFEGQFEQQAKQIEQHWAQSIIGKSVSESLKDDFSIGIQRNGQLFDDGTNHFSESCRSREIAEDEKSTTIIRDESYPIQSQDPRIQLNGKVEFSLEHSNHCFIDGLNVTSTVTYTDRLYKKMARTLRFSEKMSHYGRANFWKTFNNEKDYSPKTRIEGMKSSFTRASSVFVVYTDQNLLASQSGIPGKVRRNDSAGKTLSHHSNTESAATSKAENLGDIGIDSVEQRDLTSNITAVMPVLQNRWERSGEISSLSGSLLSYSMFAKTDDDEGKESLKCSSTWLLKNEKPRGTVQTNVFERCERESIAGDGSMLHHADCLMRLNFFAERITEQIAELAAVELGNCFRAELNPRARYFLQMRADIDSQEESAPIILSESDEEIEGKITLGLTEKKEPQSVVVLDTGSSRSSPWFSLFGGSTTNGEDRSRSPISFLWRTSHRQSDASSRKSSPDGRNEFMDLLRRTSGTSSNGSDMSTKLPDSALAGLSSEEREHIEKVLNAANRRSRSSQSTPTASRRQSIYKLPDMNDFELCERVHIESVIEKAEKALPFVIKITNADTVREDSDDEEKFGSTVNQTTSNTNEPEESIYDKSKFLLDKPTGSASLSERLEKQQNEKIFGEETPETSVMKVEQESSLDAKADLEKSRRSEANYEISDAEMEHIRKVTEAAMIMGADNQWISWSGNGQKTIRNLQNMTVANSLIANETAEELNTSEDPNRDRRSEPNKQDVRTTVAFFVERMELEKILNAKEMICEVRKQKVENSETNEADDMGDTNLLQKSPSFKSFVIKTNPFEKELSKAKSVATDMEGMKISQNYEGLEKKLTEEVAMHVEELEGQIKEPKRFENPIPREIMETKTVSLTGKELAQIRLIDERAKQLEKSKFTLEGTEKYKYQEIQNTCMIDDEELGQTKVAGKWVKELQPVDGSFLCRSKTNKQKKEKNECLLKELEVEETAIVENLKEGINFPERDALVSTVEGKAKHLEENGFFKKKEAETTQDEEEENNTLTEEELMQIRVVEQRAKQMEEFFIFEGQATKVLQERKRKDSHLATSKLATEEKPQNHLTEEELEHIKEVEKNAILQLEMPLQQKDAALGEVAFKKFASMLNPFKNSVITTLSFKSNVDEAKLSQSTEFARDVSKANKQIVDEAMKTINEGKAYSENQNFKTDVPTIKETDYTHNTEVLVTKKDLASIQAINEYPENQDLGYISSSESSDFGPGTSDEDENIDMDSVKSFDLFSETVPSISEFKGDGFPKVKKPSTKYSTIKNRELSLEVIPSPIHPIHTELLPNSRTEVCSHRIPQKEQILDMTSSSFTSTTQVSVQLGTKDSDTDEQTVDRFAGLTEEEIEHIKMVDLQFELENAKDISKVSTHNDEDSEVEDDSNFINEMVANTEEYEPQGQQALNFINVDDEIRSDIHVDIASVESEKDLVHDTNQIPLKRFTANDKLLEQSVERNLTSSQRGKSWQNAHTERDNKVKSLEELGREVNIGKWYEERLSSLRNSLCIEETPEIPGFDLKLYNLTIIITKGAL